MLPVMFEGMSRIFLALFHLVWFCCLVHVILHFYVCYVLYVLSVMFYIFCVLYFLFVCYVLYVLCVMFYIFFVLCFICFVCYVLRAPRCLSVTMFHLGSLQGLPGHSQARDLLPLCVTNYEPTSKIHV